MQTYNFRRTDIITIRNITGKREDDCFIDLSADIWQLSYKGVIDIIEWSQISSPSPLIDYYKGYLAHRIETRSPATARKDIRLIKFLDSNDFTPSNKTILSQGVLNFLMGNRNLYFSFKKLIGWIADLTGDNFSSLESQIEQVKPNKGNSYEKLFLNQFRFPILLKTKLLQKLDGDLRENRNYERFSTALIVLLAYELGLRPVQIFALNCEDFRCISNSTTSFYSLRVLKAKKISSKGVVKAYRSVSEKLGKSLSRHIIRRKSTENATALFVDKSFKRLSGNKISRRINDTLREIGFDFEQFEGRTILRHNLAQALADQGTPAEVISEIMMHNSTVSARAYVAATPEISEIKSRSLGKSKRFSEILHQLETGTPLKKEDTDKESWVHGLVGEKYIGGIGACGISKASPCPKNPVYSCYTCQKFHPFRDGPHTEVLESLQLEAQKFLDIAGKSGDFKFNRTVEQLEFTIESVLRTLDYFKDEK